MAANSTTQPAPNSYYSSIHPNGHTINDANDPPPQTDITITNNAGVSFNADVPNTPVHDTLGPNQPINVDHVYNQIYSGNTTITLSDMNGRVIFSGPVWKHAVFNVTNNEGVLTAQEIAS